jgi:hypothetical protein
MNPPNITKRLSRDTNYKKNGSSYTDNLSDADIKKKLEDYVRVKKEDVPTIPLNTHIIYFSLNPNTPKDILIIEQTSKKIWIAKKILKTKLILSHLRSYR